MTSLLIKLFVRGGDTKDNAVRARYGTLGSFVGVFSNILLCIIKISIGVLSGSLSIIADGLNNLADMGSSVVTMIGFKLANKPADRDHPFGHGRMEYMSAFIVSFLILIVGFELLTGAVKTLISGDGAPTFTVWSIAALVVSILIKLWLFLFNRKIGKTIDSSALIATAKDCLNDCISTSAILAAALISSLVALPFNLDAVMAIGVALFILWSGFSSAKDTIDEILGGPPETQLIKDIEDSILSFDDFLGIHDLIVHNYGPGRQFASVHVEVPQNVDIVKCHEKIDLCEKYVSEKLGLHIVIHMDPIDTESETVALARARMTEILKEIDECLSLHDFRMTPAGETRTNLIFDVVIPPAFRYTAPQLNSMICKKAQEVDKTYTCVITFDIGFVR